MTNDQTPMTKQPSQDHGPWENGRLKHGEHEPQHFVLKEEPDGRPQLPFDLEERTAKFGEAIIRFCKKEAKETPFFLRMAGTAEPSLKDEARVLWQEAKELHPIFCSIFRKCRSDSKGLQ